MCLHDERCRDLFDLKIFIHCDLDVALGRRILRDISERGRDVSEVLKRYNRFVKPDFEKFVKPQIKFVDLIIPGGARNDIALNFVIESIQNTLKKSAWEPQAEPLQRIESSRKLSVNTVNKLDTKPKRQADACGLSVFDNHIPLSKELRRTAEAFFHQLSINPDVVLLASNLKYLSRLAREDILHAMSSDFQRTPEEIQKLVVKVDSGGSIESDSQEGTQNEKIYFIRKKSILDRTVSQSLVSLIKKIDNFPVYVQVDFITREQVALICKSSPNTHLFSLYYLESAEKFVESLSPGAAEALLKL